MDTLLIITGTMGAGKTTVLGEASDILCFRHIAHAAIDLDTLGLAYLSPGADLNDLMYRNLQSVCNNYASVGVNRLMVARAVETRSELDLCCGIVSATRTVVCRIIADVATMQKRVEMRELGTWQAKYVARVAELNDILDGSRLEDFAVTNEYRSPSDAAREMLVRAGWISI